MHNNIQVSYNIIHIVDISDCTNGNNCSYLKLFLCSWRKKLKHLFYQYDKLTSTQL